MKVNKYKYFWVVQGRYDNLHDNHFWEDLCQSEIQKEARLDLMAYRTNITEGKYRLIQRRELNKKIRG